MLEGSGGDRGAVPLRIGPAITTIPSTTDFYVLRETVLGVSYYDAYVNGTLLTGLDALGHTHPARIEAASVCWKRSQRTGWCPGSAKQTISATTLVVGTRLDQKITSITIPFISASALGGTRREISAPENATAIPTRRPTVAPSCRTRTSIWIRLDSGGNRNALSPRIRGAVGHSWPLRGCL